MHVPREASAESANAASPGITTVVSARDPTPSIVSGFHCFTRWIDAPRTPCHRLFGAKPPCASSDQPYPSPYGIFCSHIARSTAQKYAASSFSQPAVWTVASTVAY